MFNKSAEASGTVLLRQGAKLFALALLLGAGGTSARAQEQSLDTPTYRFLSGPGTAALLGAGVLRGLVARNRAIGRTESLHTADALATSLIVAEVFKHTVQERRPDRSSDDSFPSGHAAAAFAVAAMQSHYHSNEAPLWFAGATIIGDSRIRLHKHYFHDVLAGGILGVLTAEIEQHQPRGLLVAPFYHPNLSERGIAVVKRF